MYIETLRHTYIYIHIHTYIHTFIHTYIPTYLCMYKYIYIYVYRYNELRVSGLGFHTEKKACVAVLKIVHRSLVF